MARSFAHFFLFGIIQPEVNLRGSPKIMSKTFLNKKEKSYLKELFGQLAPFKKDIICLKLFGSKARGDYNKYSDIDLLLAVRDKKREFFEKKVSRFVTEVLLKGGPFFSIKIYPFSKFQTFITSPTFFIRRINKEAVDLWPKKNY